MASQFTYPGVYIQEFAPAAPIEGVGTNTAAFIGVAAKGELDTPTKVTTWDQFRATFGEHPVPGFYLWYAVRGFFDNGGQVCYVVRASNGEYAGIGLDDPANALPNRANLPMLRVRARQPGPAAGVFIQITGKNLLGSADGIYQPSSSYTILDSRRVNLPTAAEAAKFRPGDWLDLGSAGARVQVAAVSGSTVRLASELTGPADSAGLRLADAPKGARTVRVRFPNPPLPGVLGAGTMLTIKQGALSDSQIVETVQTEPLATTPPTTTYRVSFREGLSVPLSLDPANQGAVNSEEFDIEVGQGNTSSLYENLVLDAAHPRHYLTVVNGADQLVRLEPLEPPPASKGSNSLPDDTGGQSDLIGGAAEDLAAIRDKDFSDALDTLRQIDDVNLISVPDCLLLTGPQGTPQSVQTAVIAHCEQLADRFGVLDSLAGLPLFGADSIEGQRASVDSTRGYAALYYPWLRVSPAGPGAPVLVPPSGHVCGIIARSDASRGVHKAPANEIVNGALGVERTMSDVDQGQLNMKGINVVRTFSGGRPMLWGARTTASDKNWQYVNVRRLFLFLEESIQEGIRGAVFEPNNTGLWAKLRRTITEFLTRVWKDGALFGTKAEEAFYVRIDETLNPDSSRALGRLYIEIGVRPSYPAEFIIVRIGIWQGGSEVTEA
jgi:hypothetical protein